MKIHGDHESFELEIFGADRYTLDLGTVEGEQVHPVDRHEGIVTPCISFS